MKINKSLLQFFAAFWILIFHLWINVTGSIPEQYLIRIGYVGVDIFFFVSAYSLADKELNYGSFIKSRFSSIYVKFVLFVLAAAVWKSWKFDRILKTVFFLNFFEKGGGAFLWFLPAILLFYLLYPFFLKVRSGMKYPIVLLVWAVFSILLEKVVGYNEVFIFTNRIPVILLGAWCKTHDLKPAVTVPSLLLGLVLLYFYGFTAKLNTPIDSLYFVLAAPAVLGFASLSAFLPTPKLIRSLSKATLEMYAVQMIWGPTIVSSFYKMCRNALVTNLLSFTAVIFISWILSAAFAYVQKLLQKKASA